MQAKDILDTFSASFVFVYLGHDAHFVTTHFGETIVGKQTDNPFSLAHDTLPYISMQTDHDLINLMMT